jgi:hypothetical protein
MVNLKSPKKNLLLKFISYVFAGFNKKILYLP